MVYTNGFTTLTMS